MAELARVRLVAEQLIEHHLGGRGWGFGFDHAKRRAGLCNFTERRITVSRHIAAKLDDEEVRQVLLHEIAHALAGSRAGHGPEWRRSAREIGYRGERTHSGAIASELAPWLGVCPAGHEHVRFRRPTRPLSCGTCARGYSAQHEIAWRQRG